MGTLRCERRTCWAAGNRGRGLTSSYAICCTAAVFRPDCRPLSARKSSSTLRLLLRLLEDRKSVGEGKSVDLGGRRIIKKKKGIGRGWRSRHIPHLRRIDALARVLREDL